MILVDPEGDDVLVEVPYPGSDLKTPEVGVALFREARARACSSRGGPTGTPGGTPAATPPAPRGPPSTGRTAPCSPPAASFNPTASTAKRGPTPTWSSPPAPPPPALVAARDGLLAAGFEAGLWEGGDRYRSLAATKNRQGASVRDAGGLFVHVEISRRLREDGGGRRRLTEALARGIRAGQGRGRC